MKLLTRLACLPALAFTLSACDSPAPDPTPPPEPPAASEAAETAAEPTEPGSTRRPALADHDTGVTRPPPGATDTPPGIADPTLQWWDDDALVDQLGLHPEQRTTLLEFRRSIHAAELEGRAELRALEEQAAGLDGDSERLSELQTSIGQLRERLEDSDAAWQETVRSTLSPAQRRQLEALLDPDPLP